MNFQSVCPTCEKFFESEIDLKGIDPVPAMDDLEVSEVNLESSDFDSERKVYDPFI